MERRPQHGWLVTYSCFQLQPSGQGWKCHKVTPLALCTTSHAHERAFFKGSVLGCSKSMPMETAQNKKIGWVPNLETKTHQDHQRHHRAEHVAGLAGDAPAHKQLGCFHRRRGMKPAMAARHVRSCSHPPSHVFMAPDRVP